MGGTSLRNRRGASSGRRCAWAAGAAVAILAAACASPRSADVEKMDKAPFADVSVELEEGEWHVWGGDSRQLRYSPLRQITRETVQNLEVAWRWTADASGSPASSNFKSTPLMDDGVLYTPWLGHGAAAIDAGSGKTLWTFTPEPADIGGRAPSLASRSLTYWTDGTTKRLYHNSLDGRLIAIDARTGRPARDFGKEGAINLREGLVEGRAVTDVTSVSPALVVGDVVVVQVLPAGGRNKESTPGFVRGFDVRTGKLLWTFHTIPQGREFGAETWENGSGAYTGNAGVWTMMSADPEMGLVYLPIESGTHDFYGGHRLGDGLFAESIVCLDARTGERRWHFQIVHHGVWDYDAPSAPILHDVVTEGRRIRAVTLLTKQNMSFVFDRVTGNPVWPVEERPVPQEGAPAGERLSPTQPFTTRPEPYSRLGFHEDDLVDFTPAIRAEALAIAARHHRGPIYTPIVEAKDGVVGTWIFPGYGGGANWNGAAFDPETGMMYVPIRHKPYAAGLVRGDPRNTNFDWVNAPGGGVIQGPRGLPILKPPYSELVATDMNEGEHRWRTPIGGAPDYVRNHPDLQGLGLDFDRMGQFDIRPSPLLTGDLIFMGESGNLTGGTGGPMFRAFDKRTGEVVWEREMPTLVTGAPMTYLHEGRQYIVVAVSRRGAPAELVALTLGDGKDDPSTAAPSPAPPPPKGLAASQPVRANPEEITLGATAYARTCAACHGADGRGLQGGNAPALRGRTDVAELSRVVRQGAGEMPQMASLLSPAEVEAVAKFIATRFREEEPPRD